MNSKQRKQADKLRAAALDGLESKQQHVEAQIAILLDLQEKQQWFEKSRTVKADYDKNLLLVKRMDAHHDMDRLHEELHKKSTELANLFAELEVREAELERRQEMHKDNVSSAEGHLAAREKDLDARAVLIDMANKPVKETINEILMLLELEETPEEIAKMVRKKHNILEPKW